MMVFGVHMVCSVSDQGGDVPDPCEKGSVMDQGGDVPDPCEKWMKLMNKCCRRESI